MFIQYKLDGISPRVHFEFEHDFCGFGRRRSEKNPRKDTIDRENGEVIGD
jgi:hypothetical protein